MASKAVVLALLALGMFSPQPAGAYEVVLYSAKLQEGGLPSQAGSFDFEVGRNLSTLTKSQLIDDLEGAWARWESRMNSGVSTAFDDVGNVALPWAGDGRNTIQFVQEGDGFLARCQRYGQNPEPWRVGDVDIKFNKCGGDCWGDCPFQCAGEQREVDLVSICTHEMGHAHGLHHCDGCGTSQTCMIPSLPTGNCVLLDIGSVDSEICNHMYRHGSFDDHEPDNDLWDGAEDIGTLNGSLIGEETYGEGDLGGVLDHDIFEVYISHQPPPEMMLYFFVMAPVDLDITFEVYHGSQLQALVDNNGVGGHEWYDASCEGGTWKVHIFCRELTSNTWSEDPFVLWICTYVPTQHVLENRPTPSPVSMSVFGNPSALPLIRLEAIRRPTRLVVFDVSGREVASRSVPVVPQWDWRLPELSTGIYFARLLGGSTSTGAAKRVVVVR